MPRATSLAFYAIKIRNVPEREDETVSAFGDEEDDFLDLANDRLGALRREAANNEEAQHIIRVKRLARANRQIYGIIETGEYGIESELVDVQTSRLAHRRQTTEADMMPFYFLIDIPEGVDEGILLIQRSGTFGIRKLLHGVMAPNFHLQFPELKLRFSPLVEAAELEKYARGRVE